MFERAKRAQSVAQVLWAASALLVAMPSSVFAQEQTTQQLPIPTGQTQTQSDDKRWAVTFDSDVRYFSTKVTTPGQPTVGSDVTYVPMGFGVVGTPNDDWKLEFGIRGGQQHIVTFQGNTGNPNPLPAPLAGVANSTYSGWVDTTVSSTVTYLAISGMQPFISMSTNIPTGHSLVTGAPGANPSDPDITQIAGFGVGWNFGPTIGVNIPITPNLLYTISLGYTQRNPFTRVGPDVAAGAGFSAIQTLFPGNDTTLTSALGYQSGPWSLQLSAAITGETTTMVDSRNLYQAGDSYQVSAAAGYAWNDAWSSKLTANFAHIDLNQNLNNIAVSNPGKNNYTLSLETFNTNNNVTSATFDTTYKVGDLRLGPSASFMFREHNGYDMQTALFVPAKTVWFAGGVFEYAVAKQFSVNGRAQYIWGSIDSTALPPAPVMNITGWVYSIGAKAQF
jgi:hypothetical protein